MGRAPSRSLVPVVVVLFEYLLVVLPAFATDQWATDPAVNNPVCVTGGDQRYTTAVSDGLGGMIVTWEDGRSAGADIYAQRMSAEGIPQWLANGAIVCAAAGSQSDPVITTDGAGGAIIAWVDMRGGSGDIYAQRCNGSGAMLWTPNGVRVCNAAGAQNSVVIASDRAGGAALAWVDGRIADDDIYAQRLRADSTAMWTTNGVAVCVSARAQAAPRIVWDQVGAAFIAWHDFRNGLHNDIYLQRLNLAGMPQWITNGAPVCRVSGDQEFPVLVTDGGGKATVAWEDLRSGLDIYAQRMASFGSPMWDTSGVAVCAAANNQDYIAMVRDGDGSIIAWEDRRGGSTYDIYAQRLNSSGAGLWGPDGKPVSAATGSQRVPVMIPDGPSEVMIAWHDTRSGTTYDIYAQQLDLAGAPLWMTNGVPVSTGTGDQLSPAIVADGIGGLNVAWEDRRSGNYDIYAQHVRATGSVGAATTVPEDHGDGLELVTLPNPAPEVARIAYNLSQAGRVRAELFDARGRRVRTIVDSVQPAGRGGFEVNSSDLAPGVYVLRVTAGGSSGKVKLVRP